MRDRKRGVSLGTVLALLITASVIVGCVYVFARIRSGNPQAHMSAQKVVGLVGDALHGATPAPVIQSTVRTVTVTLAPAPSPTAVKAQKPTQPPRKQTDARASFSMTIGGVTAFESDISDGVYDRNKKTFSYKSVLSSIQRKVDGDLTMTVLPQGINVSDHKYGDGLAPAAVLEAVEAAGFRDVLLNTSHALDQGIQGVNATVGALAKRGLSCGGVTAGSARQHRVLQVNGVPVAVLAYTDSLTAKGKIARESQPGVMELFHLSRAEKDIAAARKNGAEFVIVSLYWGRRDSTGVTAAMRNTANALAEAGADLILGYQPTRVLPVEMVSVPDENGIQRQCLIAYSMGTLLSESREGYDISGMLLHLTVSIDKGRMSYDSVTYTPTYIWRQKINNKMQYRVVCASDPAPKAMDAKQREYMGNALKRIRNTLKNSPVEQR